jgi:hypothetical protein
VDTTPSAVVTLHLSIQVARFFPGADFLREYFDVAMFSKRINMHAIDTTVCDCAVCGADSDENMSKNVMTGNNSFGIS